MKSKLGCAAFAVLLFGSLARCQTPAGRYDSFAIGSDGKVVEFPTVRVCTWSATPANPCTTLSSIYRDFGLTLALPNPFTGDALGNFGFNIAPGRYTLQITGHKINFPYNLSVVVPCDPSICGQGGAGSVVSFAAPSGLVPLFTTSVSSPTTAPILSFALSNAGAHQFFGNNTGSTAAPAYVQPSYSDLSGTIPIAQTPLTTRGDILTVNSTPVLSRLALGTSGQCLGSNGTDLTYISCVGTPAGSTTAVQFNNAGAFGGDATNFFYNSGTHAVTLTGALTLGTVGTSAGQVLFSGSTSGTATLKAAAAAGTPTVTLPITTGSLAYYTGSAPTVGTCPQWAANGSLVSIACSGGGTVTSAGFAAPTGFTVTNSPVTGAGTLTFAMPTGWTTGDLLLGNGPNSVARLPVGANGECLTSNGTTGIWGSCAAGSIGGSGTTPKIPLFTGTATLGDSALSDSGTTITSTEQLALPAGTIAFSATPVFDASKKYQTLTLTANVTSSTIINSVANTDTTITVCQDATGGRQFVWPTTFSTPYALGANGIAARLTSAGVDPRPSACTQTTWTTSNGTNWTRTNSDIAGKPQGTSFANATLQPAICYVATYGNNLNDGLSWGSAKQTVDSCLTALQANGGTIYMMDGGGPACNNPVRLSSISTTNGVWLVGPNDSNFSGTIPAGWLKWSKPITFEGVAGTGQGPGIGSGGVTCVTGFSTSDVTKPAFNFSGTNQAIKVKNLRIAFPARAVTIGVDSGTGARHGDSSADIEFDHVLMSPTASATTGPTVDIASNALWIWFNYCSIDGNMSATNSYQGSSIYLNADSGQGPGLIYINNTEVNSGGVHFQQAGSSPSIFINNLTQDVANPQVRAAVWLDGWNNNATASLQNIAIADILPGDLTVKITPQDSSATPFVAGGVVSMGLPSGPASTVGPQTFLGGGNPSNSENQVNSVIGQRAGGFYSGAPGSTSSVHIAGVYDETKLADVPFTVKYASLLPQAPASWAAATGTAVVTQNVVAPDKTTNAFNLSSASGLLFRQLNTPAQSIALNDWVIFAVATRNANAATTSIAVANIQLSDSTAKFASPINNQNFNMFAPIAGDGNWQWASYAVQVGVVGTGTSAIQVKLNCDATRSYDFWSPMLIYIPASSGMTQNEVLEYANALVPHAETLSIKDVSLGTRGTRASIPDPGSAFFAKFQGAPFTADRTFTFPNVSGTLPVISGAPVTGNCVKWISSTQIGDQGSICGGGGGGSPGGLDTQVQFNNTGSFGASPNLTWVSPILTIGSASSATGQLNLAGITSGAVSIKSQNTAGTYNFNLPISAGTSGQPLLSGGGAAAPMTFGTLGIAAGGTGQITKAAAFNALAPNTATGGLILGTGANAYGNLAIGANNTCLTSNGTTALWASCSSSGTVTSVAMTVPSWLTVAGSPIVNSGTLAVSPATGQTSNRVIGTGAGTTFGPVSLTTADLPFTYSGNTTELGTVTGAFTAGNTVVSDASGNLIDSGTTGGSGTVTSFSAGTLSPLFTTSVATATSTPALTFSLSTATAHKFFGNNTASTAAPGFQSIGTGDLPFTYSGNTTVLGTTSGTLTNGHCVSIDASGNLVDSGLVGCGGAASGTVTSVGMTVPSWLAVTGSPIVTSGTLAVAAATGQTIHKVIGTGATTSFSPITLGTLDLPFTYSGNTTQLGTVTGAFTAGNTIVSDASGNLIDSGSTGGTGTVTSFSSGNLSPLFTTSVATATSTPAQTFSLSTASAHTTFMNNTGSTAAPGFQSIGTADLPFTYSGNTTKLATTTGTLTNGNCVSIDASGNLVDNGAVCGGGGGGGSVTSVGLAASTGFTVSGSPVTGAGTLTLGMPTSWTTGDLLLGNGANSVSRLAIGTNGTYLKSNGTTASWQAGGTVTSVAQSFTGGLVSVAGSPVTTSGTLALTVAGTSGGVPYFSSSSTWASSAALTANLPVIGGGAGVAPTVGTRSGNTTAFVTTTGVLTNGHCVSIDANSNFVDSGAVGCGGSGGTVTSAALAAPTGFTVSGSPVTTSGTLTFAMPASWTTGDLLLGNGVNSVSRLAIGANNTYLKSNGTTASWATAGSVTSVAQSFTGGLISVAGSPVTTSGTLALTVAGTSGGIPYFSGASTWASSAALTANLPVIGGGAGVAPTVGTRTGNTTVFATSTGTRVNGHCASWDASGNIVDSGTVGCGGGGGGTVTTFSAPTGFQVTNPTTTPALAMPTSWTTGDLLLGNGANSVARLGVGTVNQCLVSTGTTATWGPCVTGSGITGTGTNLNVTGFTGTNTIANISGFTYDGTGLLTTTKNINQMGGKPVANAGAYAGADIGIKINACLTAIGQDGVCDARGITTGLTTSTTIAVGLNQTLLLPGQTITSSANPTITVSSGSTVEGMGYSSTTDFSRILVTTSGATGVRINAAQLATAVTGIHLKGFRLSMNVNNTGTGLDMSAMNNSTFEQLMFSNWAIGISPTANGGCASVGCNYNDFYNIYLFGPTSAGSGVFLRQATNAQHFYGLRFSHWLNDFLIGTNVDSPTVNDITITGAEMEAQTGAGGAAVNVVRGANITIIGGRCEGCDLCLQTANDTSAGYVFYEGIRMVSNVADISDLSGKISGVGTVGTLTGNQMVKAVGAAPTLSGLMQYDSTSNTMEYGSNGTNVKIPAFSGDLAGGTPLSPQVSGIQGQPVAATAPAANQVLSFVGGAWTPTSLALTGSGTSNTMTKWTGTSTIGNSLLTDNATTLTYTGSGGISADHFTSTGTGDLTLQPATDNAVVIKQFNGTNTADILDIKDKTGTDLITVDPTGNMSVTQSFTAGGSGGITFNQTGGHIKTNAASNDISGTIAISAATSAAHTFATAYASAPVCVLTPTSNSSAVGEWWVTATTTAVTAHVATSGTITFNYHCVGAPN